MTRITTKSTNRNSTETGFTLLELLLIVAVVMIASAMAIPAAHSAIASYQLDAAVDSATGAVQAARYQAIMHGYMYQIDFNSATNQFQVSSEIPPSASFSTVSNPVPISGSPVTMGVGAANQNSAGHLILQLKPNGSILVSSGQSMPVPLTIAYNGTTIHLTVSNYGAISKYSTTP
jgi:type II secretory pathway pseudopilin PulG